MVQLQATKENGNIIISIDSFDHLLNCLANQQYINDVNADASTCDYKQVQKDNQAAIDDFYHQCRRVLHG